MIIGTITDIAKRTVQDAVGAAVRDVAALMIATLFGAIAVVAGLVALYFALVTVWPPYWAAAAIAGLMLAGILIVFAVRSAMAARPVPEPAPALPQIEDLAASLLGDTGALARTALDEAEARYRRDPAGALVAAAAIGVIAGLMQPKR